MTNCPICNVPMDEVNVRATKKRPWRKALECPQCGWFEVQESFLEQPQEVPADE